MVKDDDILICVVNVERKDDNCPVDVECVHCGIPIKESEAEEYEVDDVQGSVYYCEVCW